MHLPMNEGKLALANAGDKQQYKVALLFDCDGVIVDTEQLHRR